MDTYKKNKNSPHICVLVVVMNRMCMITGYVICCWNIVIDNCMICELCDLLKRRRHYKLCDLLLMIKHI